MLLNAAAVTYIDTKMHIRTPGGNEHDVVAHIDGDPESYIVLATFGTHAEAIDSIDHMSRDLYKGLKYVGARRMRGEQQ
jgi:hypothetical protein